MWHSAAHLMLTTPSTPCLSSVSMAGVTFQGTATYQNDPLSDVAYTDAAGNATLWLWQTAA